MSMFGWLFSDKCPALIDPSTGKALTGAALADARQNPKSPRCGYRVTKKALFCSRCGSTAPGGWWKCPGCGKWVGNESNFCWNCKQPLYPQARLDVAGGVWQKPADAFAERFEIGDIQRLQKDGLNVQEGTAAILLDGGAFRGVIGPGRHNVESIARKINWFGNPPPRSVILLDNGDVCLPLRVAGLRSAQEIPVDFYAEATLHFAEKGAEAFTSNLFKSRQRLTYAEIEEILAGEVRYTIENVTNTATIEDLVRDPERRTRVEDALQTTLKTSLERYGMEIARVACADFSGKEYEALRAKSGEIELKRRQLELDQRLRELIAADRMQEFKTEADLAAYVRQLAQEKQVAEENAQHELSLLQLLHRQEIGRKEAEFAMAQQMAQLAHDLGMRQIADEYKRQAALLEAQNEVKITEMWIKVRVLKDEAKATQEARLAKTREGLSLQTLISLTDDPAKRADLLELSAQLQARGQSADVILATQAGRHPELARAFADMERGKREDRDRDWAERKKLLDETAERLERILRSALETTSEAAKHPSTGTQVFK